MANLALRSTVSGLLPEAVRRRLRPIGFGLLGLVASGRLKKAVQMCQASARPLKLVIGAGVAAYDGWISTDVYVLDIRSPENWERYFRPESIDAMLSEHVLEHLSLEENRVALKSAYNYLKPGGRFRIAVPDGNRRDPFYHTDVAPPADGHQVLFTVASLSALLTEIGFNVKPLEYFDEQEAFQAFDWNSDDGYIGRSIRYDRQEPFKRGDLFYTSLIVDAVKP
jgi:predicted SAM-dependent methyltransferase